jgi:hypothetical protein
MIYNVVLKNQPNLLFICMFVSGKWVFVYYCIE